MKNQMQLNRLEQFCSGLNGWVLRNSTDDVEGLAIAYYALVKNLELAEAALNRSGISFTEMQAVLQKYLEVPETNLSEQECQSD